MSTQFETLGQALEAFPKRRFHILAAPRLMEPVPNLRLTATVVLIKPNTPKTYRKEELQGWAITKAGLLELAQEAGIKFGRTQISYDLEHSPTATVMGKRMIAPGQWSEMPGTYALNRTDRIKELEGRIEEAQKDAEFDRAELEQMKKDFAAQMIGLDRYGEQMSETGAMLRAIRALLGIEHVYSAKQLRKQFVVMRLELVADEEAVKVAQGLLALQVGDLFGEGSVAPPLDPQVRRVAEALLAKVLPTEPPKVEVEAPPGGSSSASCKSFTANCSVGWS